MGGDKLVCAGCCGVPVRVDAYGVVGKAAAAAACAVGGGFGFSLEPGSRPTGLEGTLEVKARHAKQPTGCRAVSPPTGSAAHRERKLAESSVQSSDPEPRAQIGEAGSALKSLADREGFEPSRRLPAYTRSRRAPSTTRPPAHRTGALA